MFDATNTCRTCMKTDCSFISLFDPWNEDENTNFRVADALVALTSTQVAREDGLPQFLCVNCIKTLEMSYTFRNQALKVDLELRRLFLLKSGVKTEPEEFKTEDDYSDSLIDFDYIKAEEDIEKIEEEDGEKFEEHVGKIEEEDLDPKDECSVDQFECYVCCKQYKSKTGYLKHMASHKGKLQCPECNKKFCKQKSLDLHMTLAHTDIEEFYADCNNTYENSDARDEVKTEVEPSEKEKFACNICNQTFVKRMSLASHMKKHNSGKTSRKDYKCNECGIVFTSKPLLRRHMKLHTNVRPYQCLHCTKRYSRADQLKEHVKKHSSVKTNVCPYCKKGFSQVCNLRDHIRIHTGETPFLCSECGKGFNNSSNLRQHMLRHTGVKSFSCNLCPKSFATKGQMTTHMMTHSGAHPHKCEQCGSSFTKPQSLKKHSLIHTGVKPYKCDVCPKSFLVKDHLVRHQRIHTGEKPYRCQFCSRAFTQSNDVTKHLRMHVGQNVHQCTVCDQRFRTKNELNRHYPSHYVNGVPPKPKPPTENHNAASSTIPPSITNSGTNIITRSNRVKHSKISTGEIIDKTVGRIYGMGGKMDAAVQGTVGKTDGTGNKVNGTDHRITITFNPNLVDKDTGIAGSITIDMDPGPS